MDFIVHLSLQWVLNLLMGAAVLWAPGQAMACIPGLQWGMDSSTVKQRLEFLLNQPDLWTRIRRPFIASATSTSANWPLNS